MIREKYYLQKKNVPSTPNEPEPTASVPDFFANKSVAPSPADGSKDVNQKEEYLNSKSV